MERELVYTCRNCGLTYRKQTMIPEKILSDVLRGEEFKVSKEFLNNIHNCEGNGHGGWGVADLITIIPGY